MAASALELGCAVIPPLSSEPVASTLPAVEAVDDGSQAPPSRPREVLSAEWLDAEVEKASSPELVAELLLQLGLPRPTLAFAELCGDDNPLRPQRIVEHGVQTVQLDADSDRESLIHVELELSKLGADEPNGRALVLALEGSAALAYGDDLSQHFELDLVELLAPGVSSVRVQQTKLACVADPRPVVLRDTHFIALRGAGLEQVAEVRSSIWLPKAEPAPAPVELHGTFPRQLRCAPNQCLMQTKPLSFDQALFRYR